jgi:hypothetical protein
MKREDKKKDKIPWGKLFKAPMPNGKVMSFAWKDNALCLFISNCNDREKEYWTIRKRPSETSSAVKTARAFFRDKPTKEVKVPEFNWLYNKHIGAVDQGD